MNRLADVLTIRDGEIKPRRRRETIKVCAHCGDEIEILTTADREEHFVFCPSCETYEVPVDEKPLE